MSAVSRMNEVVYVVWNVQDVRAGARGRVGGCVNVNVMSCEWM